MKISLVGFMGSGKTSIGRLLALKLNLSFIDTDNLVIERVGLPVSDIFLTRGEEYFRMEESRVLSEVLKQKDDFVLATGGGIVLTPGNVKLLKSATIPILLEASAQEIYNRINCRDRPLLKSDQPLETIIKLKRKREHLYDRFENRIMTDGKSPKKIVNEIIAMLDVNISSDT